MQSKAKGARGMFTVELALVFPMIFLAILAVIYLSIIHYQNIALTSAAMQSANRIASYWQHLGGSDPAILRSTNAKGMLTAADFCDNDPYRNLLDLRSGQRLSNGQAYANTLVSGVPKFYTLSDGQLTVRKNTQNFFNPYIEVTVSRSYTNPLGNLFAALGIGAQEDRTIRATAPLLDKTEFIRNIELIQYIYEKIK